jgi:diaminopimelate epimerase
MRTLLDFLKFHGCGNDFIIVDEMRGRRTPDSSRSTLATKLCDRHFSIGADGVIFVEPADGCDGSMRLFEPAGNEADMCGNGLRCVAAFLHGVVGKDNLSILTKDGVKEVVRSGDAYRVDMGPVRTLRSDLDQYVKDDGQPTDSMLDIPLYKGDQASRACMLNTGEPHIVVFTDDVSSVDVREIGSSLNADRQRFPLGVSINFVQITAPDKISIRTYERGVYDETMACGTGATACAAAALLSGKVDDGGVVSVSTRGGTLMIEITGDGHAYMTGPATEVYAGRINVEV